jgi:putative tricarboxylic transport membrane protein
MLFSWDYLLQGFVTAFSLQNLLWAFIRCMIGTLIGVLPGIGPSSGIAILLPLTTVLPPTSAIIDELVKSHIPYVVHASTSSARTEYQ